MKACQDSKNHGLYLLVYLHSLVLGHVTLCHVTALVQIR